MGACPEPHGRAPRDNSVVGKRVLVVDDHTGFRDAVRRLLERSGLEVVGEVADGASAIVAARRLLPDIVILDVGLPDTSGFDVAAELSKQRLAPLTILVSSRKGPGDDERALAVGAHAYLDKADLDADKVDALIEARGFS